MAGEFLAGCIVGGICGFAIGLVCGVLAISVLLKDPEGKGDAQSRLSTD